MLGGLLDSSFGTTSKVRIMRLLCRQDRGFSAREIARLTSITLPATLNAISDLEKQGVLLKEVSGAQFFCRANRDHLLIRNAIQPLFEAESKFVAALFGDIGDVLKRSGTLAAWIFGSVAQGTDRPGSDLDVFVLVDSGLEVAAADETLLNNIPRWRRQFGMRVSPVVMTLDDAIEQARSGAPLLDNAVRDARLLVGEIPRALLSAVSDYHGKANKKQARR